MTNLSAAHTYLHKKIGKTQKKECTFQRYKDDEDSRNKDKDKNQYRRYKRWRCKALEYSLPLFQTYM